MNFETKTEQVREKVADRINYSLSLFFANTDKKRDLLNFKAGLIPLMIGNLFSVCLFFALSKEGFLIYSVITMSTLLGLLISAEKCGEVKKVHYLITFLVTYVYGLVLFSLADNTKGVFIFGLIYPFLSIYILKPFLGNLLIGLELVTSLVANTYINPLKINEEAVSIYVVVYIMVWIISNIMEEVNRYMEKQLMKQQEQLAFYANYDQLTKLANRRRFYEKVNELANESMDAEPMALVLVDIDNFKQINDKFGHSNGDIVLSETAERIRNTIRTSDICCRWGGEEFLLLAKVNSLASSKIFGQKICDVIGQKNFILEDNQNIHVTVSVGVVFTDDLNKIGLSNAIHGADNNLYQAKRKGKNQVVCSISDESVKEE